MHPGLEVLQLSKTLSMQNMDKTSPHAALYARNDLHIATLEFSLPILQWETLNLARKST